MMLGAAIIPESDGVRSPIKTALKFRRLSMAPQHVEQRVAFELVEPVDPLGEFPVHKERLAAGHGMRAHDGMLGARKTPFRHRMAKAAVIGGLAVMRRG